MLWHFLRSGMIGACVMEAQRIGQRIVYMRPFPFSRRRWWLVRPAYGKNARLKWRIRHYRIAAHITRI